MIVKVLEAIAFILLLPIIAAIIVLMLWVGLLVFAVGMIYFIYAYAFSVPVTVTMDGKPVGKYILGEYFSRK